MIFFWPVNEKRRYIMTAPQVKERMDEQLLNKQTNKQTNERMNE